MSLYQDMRAGLERAIELTTLPGGSSAASTGGGGRRSGPGEAWKPFWGAHQRFFKLLCVSLKVPTVVEEVRRGRGARRATPVLPPSWQPPACSFACAEVAPSPAHPRLQAKAALLAGQCVVIGLQSTGEAAADAAGLEPGPVAGFVSTTRELAARFVETHFPVARELTAEGAPARPRTLVCASAPRLAFSVSGRRAAHACGRPLRGARPARAALSTSAGAAAGLPPQPVPEALQLRDGLLARIASLQLPPNFLDQVGGG